MATEGFIKSESLREIVGVGASVDVTITADKDSFIVLVGAGLTQSVLQAKRGHVRRFRTLDSAALFLNRLGCRHVSLELGKWTPNQRTIT